MLFLRDDDLVALVLQLMVVNHQLKHQFPIWQEARWVLDDTKIILPCCFNYIGKSSVILSRHSPRFTQIFSLDIFIVLWQAKIYAVRFFPRRSWFLIGIGWKFQFPICHEHHEPPFVSIVGLNEECAKVVGLSEQPSEEYFIQGLEPRIPRAVMHPALSNPYLCNIVISVISNLISLSEWIMRSTIMKWKRQNHKKYEYWTAFYAESSPE